MDAVALRNKIKKRKPHFIKQKSKQRTSMEQKWRKPRGGDSKVKLNKKGYPKKVKVGYKGPSLARGLSRSGLEILLIKSIKEIDNADKNKIVCLASFGRKKKIEAVKKCVEAGLKILNIKDPSKFLKDAEAELSKKKEDKKKKLDEEKKPKKKEGIEAKVKEEEKKEEVSKEDKTKEEKKKVLTKRDIWN